MTMSTPRVADIQFDLEATLRSVVSLRSSIPDDALTTPILGTERSGHGVIIDPGLVVTIGYLVTEAESVWIVDYRSQAIPGYVLAYDQETGFGLVQALQKIDLPAAPMGSSTTLQISDPVIIVGAGGEEQIITAEVVAKREFAGYWEYVLDEAIFASPAHPNWGGAGLFDDNGTLCGIGSLALQTVDQTGDVESANMFVPIDLLRPILEELRTYGRQNKPPRPWLGWFVQENQATLVVGGVYDGGPAAQSGIAAGDIVMEINGKPVSGLADLFRSVWGVGDAGVEIPVTFLRNKETHTVTVNSVDRNALLKSYNIH